MVMPLKIASTPMLLPTTNPRKSRNRRNHAGHELLRFFAGLPESYLASAAKRLLYPLTFDLVSKQI